jgi:hypothetical protein
MATSLNTTTFSHALKTLWSTDRVERMLYEDQPFLAMVPKDTEFYGANKVIDVIHGPGGGRSADFSDAQSNRTGGKGTKFTITRASDYSTFGLTNEVLEASENNKGSLLDALDTEVELAMYAIKRSLGISCYGAGSGKIGKISSVTAASNGVITLTNINDVTNFELDMQIECNPTETGTAGNMRSGVGTITAIDRDAGTVTFSGTITSVAANDFIYAEGDYDAKLKGLAAWIPTTAPSSTAFFGADRSVDVTRLGGVRYDGSANNPDEALQKALSRVGREGGAPTHIFTNNSDWSNVELSLGSKVKYEMTEVKTASGVVIGFQAIQIAGPRRVAKLIADPNCPAGYAYALDINKWKLHSLGKAPHFLGADGMKILREASADGYEGRIGYYAQLATKAPGHNAVITMPT